MDIVRVLRGMLRTDEPSPGTYGTAAVEPRLESDLPTSTSKNCDNEIGHCILAWIGSVHRVGG